MSEKSKKSISWANTRSGQRRLAFQVLYGLDFSPKMDEAGLRQTLEVFKTDDCVNLDFAWSLITGVFRNVAELDRIIASYLKGWRLERIAKTELGILRLLVFEMLFVREIPMKGAINEGVELAKDFGNDNSSIFVNGILDAVAKDFNFGKFASCSENEKNNIGKNDRRKDGGIQC